MFIYSCQQSKSLKWNHIGVYGIVIQRRAPYLEIHTLLEAFKMKWVAPCIFLDKTFSTNYVFVTAGIALLREFQLVQLPCFCWHCSFSSTLYPVICLTTFRTTLNTEDNKLIICLIHIFSFGIISAFKVIPLKLHACWLFLACAVPV